MFYADLFRIAKVMKRRKIDLKFRA